MYKRFKVSFFLFIVCFVVMDFLLVDHAMNILPWKTKFPNEINGSQHPDKGFVILEHNTVTIVGKGMKVKGEIVNSILAYACLEGRILSKVNVQNNELFCIEIDYSHVSKNDIRYNTKVLSNCPDVDWVNVSNAKLANQISLVRFICSVLCIITFMVWIRNMIKRKIEQRDLSEALKTGVEKQLGNNTL